MPYTGHDNKKQSDYLPLKNKCYIFVDNEQ